MNHKKRFIFGLFLYLGCNVVAMSQRYNLKIDGLLSKKYVQTPEVNSIRQVSMSSVNYSTGSVDIRIPLFDIVCGDLNLPIYLSYNSTGIKINEPSSWVGQNWFLHAEPTVTRTPRGHVDHRNYCDSETYQNRTTYEWVRRYLDNNITSAIDCMPDEYNFTLLSGGGMFMCCQSQDDNQRYTTIPYDDTKITYNGHFTITDNSGTVYEYGDLGDSSYSPYMYDMSWHATSVTAANGVDTLLFKYDNYQYINIKRHEDHITVVDDLQHCNMMGYRGGATHFSEIMGWLQDYTDAEELYRMPVVYKSFDNYTYSYQVDSNYELVPDGRDIDGIPYFPDTDIRCRRLSEINFSGNTASFIVDNNRNLHEIKVRNSDGQIIKHLVLDYEFYKQRYFLTKIKEMSSDGRCISQYKFNYNDMNLVAYPGSRAYDFWGFNNAGSISSSTSLVPRMKLYTKRYVQRGDYVAEEYDSLTIGGDANRKIRQANEQYMLYGTLSCIEHPTGAVEHFEWEANKARIYDQASNDETSSFHIIEELTGQDGIYVLGGLRIKEISILEDNIVKQRRSFAYGKREDGVGVTPLKNGINYFVREQTKMYDDHPLHWYCCMTTSRYRTLSSTPVVPITFYNGASVMYDRVSEYIHSGTQPIIKKVYDYTLPFQGEWEYLTQLDLWDYHIHNYSNWFSDHLNSIDVYEMTVDGFVKKSSEVFSYGSLRKNVRTIRGREFRNDTYECFSDQDDELIRNMVNYHMLDYSFSPSANMLMSQTYTEYMPDGLTLTTEKSYAYDNPSDILMTSQTESQGETEYTIHTSYPSNMNSGIYSSMVNKNMLDYPIEERVEFNDKVISARLCTYSAQGNCYYPDGIYTYTPGNTAQPYRTFAAYDGNAINSLYTHSHSLSYSDGRISCMTDRSNISTLYSWDNYKQYPISIRQVGGGIQFLNTYEYRPGIGLTSEIAPNGQVRRFLYDTGGRLSGIKDTDGKFVQRYSYRYVSGDN